MAEKAAISRVVFHRPYTPLENAEIFGAADVLVVPTRGEISMTALPSKLMHYMFAARPVLAICNAESELATIVTESGCGWIVAPNRPRELVQMLETIGSSSKGALCGMGEKARAYACEHFGTDTCLPALIRLIEECADAS
jgi:colanic acid biosynthesis glycosyl transferase WcaI